MTMNALSDRLLRILLATTVILCSCGGNREFSPQGDTDTGKEEPSTPNKTRLSTAADFIAFAEAVNAQDGTENEDIFLEKDIDLSSVTDWTPVGNGRFTLTDGIPTVTGPMFQGHFHGQGHHIRHFKATGDSDETGSVFGLFGIIGPGATVEDLGFESSCALSVKSASGLCARGLLAGVVCDASVSNVNSAAALRFRSTGMPAGAEQYAGGLVGCLLSIEESAELRRVTVSGKIIAGNAAGDIAPEASGCEPGCRIAAIAAGSFGTEEHCAKITDCTNEGALESSLCRAAGICATARNTVFNNCTNKAAVLGNCPAEGSGRLGGLVCENAGGCTFCDCTNYGDVTSITSGMAGGIVCLPGGGTFTRCSNYGDIRTDNICRGVFWAYAEQKTLWQSCIADGSVGPYADGEGVEDNYPDAEVTRYLGVQKEGTESVLNDINYLVRILKGVEPKLKILFIGNSFTKDAVEHLPGILAAAGIKEIKLCHMYYGGRTVEVYNDDYSTRTDYHCYTAENGSTTWVETLGKSLHSVAASCDWDIVTIQEYSGREVAWNWTEDRKADLTGLISKIKADCPKKTPDFYFVMSQAFWDFARIPSSDQGIYRNYFTTTDEMFEVISSATRKLMADMPEFKDVLATGTYLQNMRSSSLNNAMGLSRDGYHMDYGIGRYGAACLLFEKLISTTFDGIRLDGNTYRYNYSNTSTTDYSTPVTDENAPIALKAARAAMSSPYNVTPMD